MTQHLLDTPVKVATCNRCRAYVFACQVNGFKVAVDLSPLDGKGVADALMAGRAVYDQLDQGGKPWKLQARTGASEWPPFAGRRVVADHNCGTRGMNTTGVDVTEVDPPKAPAPSGAIVTPKAYVPPSYSPPVSIPSFRAKNVSPVRFDGWRHAKVHFGRVKTAPLCVVCGKHAYLRHPVSNDPVHKVCTEEITC